MLKMRIERSGVEFGRRREESGEKREEREEKDGD
jgi:hypothetical protein